MSVPDYYAILGVPRNADETTIKKAYKKLALKYHPDKTRGDPSSNDKFQQVAEAYECLINPKSRSSYDTGGQHDGGTEWERRAAEPWQWQRRQEEEEARHQRQWEEQQMRGHRTDKMYADSRGDASGQHPFQRHRATMRSALELFDELFSAMEHDMFGSNSGSGSGGFERDMLFANDPFFGGGRGGGGGGRRGLLGLMGGFDDMLSQGGMHGSSSGFQSSSFSSMSSSGFSGTSKSVSTSSFVDASGRRVTKTTTTVRHPDGRVDTNTTTDGDETLLDRLPAPSFSSSSSSRELATARRR